MSNTKSSSSGCFSSIFRKFLCLGTPQTHPSDHITELKHVDDVAKVQVQASENGPGIVARLMGLDSLPEKNWVLRGETIGQVTRSRSVNFVDYMLSFDSTRAGHRRVKTSTSFRELLIVQQGPQLLQHDQNHELLVVYMDKNKEIEFEPSSKQKENVKKEHQEKNKNIFKLKNEPRRVSRANSRAKSPLKEVSAESKKKKKKKKNQCEVKKVEYSENSSGGSSSTSVSVLNVNDFAAHQKHDISDSKSLELKVEKNFESKYEEETVMELVDKPSILTDKDINFSNWITKNVFMFEDFEDICREFEEKILDLMLHQVADELVGFHICNA